MALKSFPRETYTVPGMSIRVLLIDEHEKVRHLLASRLAEVKDIEVVGNTGDAEEGLQRIQRTLPDVVLLDMKMRRADGLEICRRAHLLNGGTPVVVLTSYGDPKERRMAHEAGAVEYLLKDVDTEKLAWRIGQLARSRGAGLPEERIP